MTRQITIASLIGHNLLDFHRIPEEELVYYTKRILGTEETDAACISPEFTMFVPATGRAHDFRNGFQVLCKTDIDTGETIDVLKWDIVRLPRILAEDATKRDQFSCSFSGPLFSNRI